MTGNESGAWELNHGGKIHRAADFDQLLSWVREYRVSSGDGYRKAGSDKWEPVSSRKEFAALLNPENQWTVSMKSGVFRAPEFDVLVQWAREGRITDDAIVEGPRTPPGGVKAAALPALASHLKELPPEQGHPVQLRIDGRVFSAGGIDTIRDWIRESRVPVDSEISLDGETWEPVSMCGLFDLEDWPKAAHGRVEEEELPEMPTREALERRPVRSVEPVPSTVEEEDSPDESSAGETPEEDHAPVKNGSFTVISGESDVTVESVKELKRLLRKRQIYSYDEIRHPSIQGDSVSVGEFLETQGRRGVPWWVWIIPAAAAVASALELLHVTEFIPWF